MSSREGNQRWIQVIDLPSGAGFRPSTVHLLSVEDQTLTDVSLFVAATPPTMPVTKFDVEEKYRYQSGFDSHLE